MISRSELETYVTLPEGSFFGSLGLFAYKNSTLFISMYIFSESERVLLLLRISAEKEIIFVNNRQPSLGSFANDSLYSVQLFYTDLLGGAQIIHRINATNTNITESCANETRVLSLDTTYLSRTFFIAYLTSETISGKARIIGKMCLGYYDTDRDGLGDIEEKY